MSIRKHYLCTDCWAGVTPQPGIWPDNGEARCCKCGRPCDDGVCIPIFPTPLLPCGTCAEAQEAAQQGEDQEQVPEVAETEAAEEQAPEAPPEQVPEPLAA